MTEPVLASVGAMVPDEPRFRGPAFNRAAQMFHEGLLTGLAESGLRADLVLSVQPIPSFPRGRRLFPETGTYTTRMGWRVRLLPYVNVHPLKWLTSGIVVSAALARWSWRHRRRDRIIHCINLSMPPGIFLWMTARLTGARLLVSVLDVFQPGALVPDRLYWRVDFALQRWLIPRVDGLMVVSDAIAEDFASGRSVCRIEGGLLDTAFTEPGPPRSAQRDPARFRIVLAGTLEPYNGVPLALDAVAMLPERFELVIAGDGSCAEMVRARAAHDRRVTYLGFLDFADVVALYASADLLLNARLTRAVDTRYFFPSKLMELLASGTPVLSTATGHVEQEYGHVLYLLREETPAGLAQAITSIAGLSPAQRRAVGTGARQFMRAKKTWTQQAAKLVRYIHSEVLPTR